MSHRRYWLFLSLALVSAPCLGAEFFEVDLRPYFDNDGIAFATDLEDGNFAFDCSYPAEQMPQAGQWEFGGVPFTFPSYADGEKNCVRLRGKTIDLPDLPAGTIYFLGSALYSRFTSAAATLYYTDGTSERQLLLFGGTEHGNLVALMTDRFYPQNRVADHGGWPIYVSAIYPQQDKSIDAVRFDDVFHGVQVFATTLSLRKPEGELANKLPPFGLASVDWSLGHRGTNRATAIAVAAPGAGGELNMEWACHDVRQSEVIAVKRGQPVSVVFDCDLVVGDNQVSLTISNQTGQKIVLTKTFSVAPPLALRTQHPVVLDAAPVEAEVLVNLDVAVLGDHRLVVELVRQGDDQSGKVIDTRTWDPVDRTRYRVELGDAETPAGTFRVRGRLMRGDDTIADADTGPIIRRAKPEGGVRRVRFDTDGMMLIDGKRTFAVGMVANFGPDDIAQFKSVGMNCVVLGEPTMGLQTGLWDLFDQLQEAGIYVVGHVSPGDDLFSVRRAIHLQRDHPALIGYHFLEEPGAHYSDRPRAIEMIYQSYREIRRLDPNHFIDMIDWPGSSYARYAVFVDLITSNRYTRGPMPVPNIVKETIYQVRQAKEASQHRKPVWMMPQMFSFLVESASGLTKDPEVPEGPTPEQVRLSGYASIIGGATGVLYFEYGYAHNGRSGDWDGKNLWDASKHVLAEIAQLRPVLEAPGTPRSVGAAPGVETWAKMHDGHWYVIAANASEKPLEASIDLSELRVAGEAQVLFENERQRLLKGGQLTDTFTADGAHVYRIKSAD